MGAPPNTWIRLRGRLLMAGRLSAATAPSVIRSGADVGREVLAGDRGADGDEVGGCALEDDPAAVVAGSAT